MPQTNQKANRISLYPLDLSFSPILFPSPPLDLSEIHIWQYMYQTNIQLLIAGTYEGKEHTTYIVYNGNIEK